MSMTLTQRIERIAGTPRTLGDAIATSRTDAERAAWLVAAEWCGHAAPVTREIAATAARLATESGK